MEISKIENKNLRKLAELRAIENGGKPCNDDIYLSCAFIWEDTPENFMFWCEVSARLATEISNEYLVYEIKKSLNVSMLKQNEIIKMLINN